MSGAAWCERASALLAAGLGSARVLELLGEPPVTAADGGAIRVAWQLAVARGAALADVLSGFGAAAREWDRIASERASALAGPRMAARMVAALPIAALGLGWLLGLNPFGVLFGSVLGWLLLCAGAAGTAMGWRWTNRLVARAAAAEPAPGFGCELTAQLIASGMTAERACQAVDQAWSADSRGRDAALALARHSGMPPVRALRAEAAAARAEAAASARVRAAQLAVTLTLPLGVCVLPAFVAWGVLPLVLSVMGSVDLGHTLNLAPTGAPNVPQ